MHHPSSTVARDSQARQTPAVSDVGRNLAATLVQSRFRGYRTRNCWSGKDGGRETVESAQAVESRSGDVSGYSVLALEVRFSKGFHAYTATTPFSVEVMKLVGLNVHFVQSLSTALSVGFLH